MDYKKLLGQCAKYLCSEGIYYKRESDSLIACINGRFVRFQFNDLPTPNKLKQSGGLVYPSFNLKDFIEIVRTLQRSNNENN